MKIKVLVAILLVALVASLSIAAASKQDSLPQQAQIEDVIKSYAWSMDDPYGKENWLSSAWNGWTSSIDLDLS
jgi:hypothetical protein